MTATQTLALHQNSTPRICARVLLRTVFGSAALTAGLFASVPVAMNGGPAAFTLFSAGSAVLIGLLLKGRLRTHSIASFLGSILLCGLEILALWDLTPTTNLLLFGAAQADSLLLALFTQLLYSVFAFFAIFLTLALRTYEDEPV